MKGGFLLFSLPMPPSDTEKTEAEYLGESMSNLEKLFCPTSSADRRGRVGFGVFQPTRGSSGALRQTATLALEGKSFR